MRSRLPSLAAVAALWAVSAGLLAAVTTRVVDWFVMTDELLYERIAFSVARSGSPLPSLHGVRIPAANTLYPLVLALVAGDGLVPGFLHRAHILNALLFTSTCIPAYLLARAAVPRLPALAVAAGSVLLPWATLSSFLLTSAIAYPALIWAVFLLQRAVERPGVATDALALAGLLAAYLARTQFVVLFLVAAVAPVVQERGVVSALRRHRLLAAAAGALLALAGALLVTGRIDAVLGAYSATTEGNILDPAVFRSFAQHLATVGLALGILPLVVGGAWLLAQARLRRPVAVVSAMTVVLLGLEVASFDLRFGGGLPRDRYLFYIAPLLLTGFAGALCDVRATRWSLLAPAVVAVAGFATAPLPVFDKLNADTPAAVVDNYLIRAGNGLAGARWTLVVCTALVLVVFALGRAFVPRRALAGLMLALTLAATTAETAYAFQRLFRTNGTSGRPITLAQGGVFDWVDRTLGTGADVTIIPYAQVANDYWATAAYWWDLEFWNRSVTRDAYIDNRFAEIQSTFPKIDLRFDPATGVANVSPTRYAAESQRDARFRLHGATVSLTRDVLLLDAGRNWRADWLSRGLDDDGFLTAGRPAELRVYPTPGQREPVLRYLSLHFLAFHVPESVRVSSNTGRWTIAAPADGDADEQVTVCVAPRGFATVRLLARGSSTVGGDLGSRDGIGGQRVRSLQLGRASLADETAACQRRR